MWLLLVYGTKVTTKVLWRVSFVVAVRGFSRIPTEAWLCSQFLFPIGPGSHRRTCAVSPGWTIRLKGPTVQSPAGVGAEKWADGNLKKSCTRNRTTPSWLSGQWMEGSLKEQNPPGSRIHCCSVTEKSQWATRIGMADQKRLQNLCSCQEITWTRPEQLDLTCKSVVLSARCKTKHPLEILPLQIVLFILNLSFSSRNTDYYI